MQRVRQNFEEKSSYLASVLPGITVTERPGFLAVDSGLPSDTYNVLSVRDMAAPAELLAAADRFNAKAFPLALWYWQSTINDAHRAAFLQHGLEYAETNIAMSADLPHIQTTPPTIDGLTIRLATTAGDITRYAKLLADLFGDSPEGPQVLAHFQRLAQHPPSAYPAMRHYLGILRGTIVATGLLFIGSETAGIYDIATREDHRRQGIGSAVFQTLLRDARATNRRHCVLQASPDGLGIYSRAGFQSLGEVHTFENRRHLPTSP
jgi:ribosomal protein S18 acetylase RimI-like enzyme